MHYRPFFFVFVAEITGDLSDFDLCGFGGPIYHSRGETCTLKYSVRSRQSLMETDAMSLWRCTVSITSTRVFVAGKLN